MWGHVPGGPETHAAGVVDTTSLSALASAAPLPAWDSWYFTFLIHTVALLALGCSFVSTKGHAPTLTSLHDAYNPLSGLQIWIALAYHSAMGASRGSIDSGLHTCSVRQP